MNDTLRVVKCGFGVMLWLAAGLHGEELPVVRWHPGTGIAEKATLNDVVWTGNAFVAVAEDRQIRWSSDGSEWITADGGHGGRWNGVSGHEGRVVAVGNGGGRAFSDGGLVWLPAAAPNNKELYAVTHGMGRFIAVGASRNIQSSTDSREWEVVAEQSGISPTYYAVTCNGVKFVAVGSSGTVEVSDDGQTWVSRNIATSRSLIAVAASPSRWLALSGNGQAWFSSDAELWTPAASIEGSVGYSGLVWNGQAFVACGGGGLVAQSADGLAWTVMQTPQRTALQAIACGGGLEVAVGLGGGIVKRESPAEPWQVVSDSLGSALFGIADNGGVMVAVGDGGALLHSADGFHWERQSVPTAARLTKVAWTQAGFIAVGEGGTILRSADGNEWATEISGTSDSFYAIGECGGRIFAVGDNDHIVVREAGVWRQVNRIFGASRLFGVAWTGSRFVAVGNRSIFVSDDGESWVSLGITFQPSLVDVVWTGSRLIAAISGSPRGFYESTDGLVWTVNDQNLDGSAVALAEDGGEVTCVTSNGSIYRMTSQTSWSVVRVGAPTGWAGDIHGRSGRWLVAGPAGQILCSDDLQNWKGDRLPGLNFEGAFSHAGRVFGCGWGGFLSSTEDGRSWVSHNAVGQGPSALETLRGGASNGGRVVVIGNGGIIRYSTDLVTWQSATGGGSDTLLDVAWNGSLFVAVGAERSILTSPDGISWTSRHRQVGANLHGVVWTGSQWVACGSDGLIARSPEGLQWTFQSHGGNYPLNKVVWDGGKLVAVSDNGMIWTSSDGTAWTVTKGPEVHPYRAVAVVNGRVIVASYDRGSLMAESATGEWLTILPEDWFQIRAMEVVGGTLVAFSHSGKVRFAAVGSIPELGAWAGHHQIPFSEREPAMVRAGRWLPNLLDYALGGGRDAGVPPVIARDAVSGHPVFSFVRRGRMPGVRLVLEGSRDAARWDAFEREGKSGWEMGVAEEFIQHDGTIQVQWIADPALEPRLLMRLGAAP